jgi:serine acetyltransferase
MLKGFIGDIRGYLLRRKVFAEGNFRSIGKTTIINDSGIIRIGFGACLWPDVKLVVNKCPGIDNPSIIIGSFSSIGDRTQIHCGSRVEIGSNVLIAWDVNIIEYDYHASGGVAPEPKPIFIEDEAWIGARCIIMKGVRIGKGSIIGAGSVVVKDVPPYMLAVGNPAKPLKKVHSWKGSIE